MQSPQLEQRLKMMLQRIGGAVGWFYAFTLVIFHGFSPIDL